MPFHWPTLNASLNGFAAILLFSGWVAIKRGDRLLHQRLMAGALIVSFLFLCCYMLYHFSGAGMTRYQGQGFVRVIYFTILLTHTPLAMLVVPFSLMAVWHAHRQNFAKHVRITKWLFPVWMYVSVTGVLIYLMLYVFS